MKFSRFELIDKNGRVLQLGSYFNGGVDVEVVFQDNNRTLKVFTSEEVKNDGIRN